jgi:hypothetical protein
MSASDAAPLPRLGEVFFDVRGHSRTMRLSWYADTGIAVFSIWQGGVCTGTFRLPIADLSRMIEILQRGPQGGFEGDVGGRRGAEYGEPGRTGEYGADYGRDAAYGRGYSRDQDDADYRSGHYRADDYGPGDFGQPDYGSDDYRYGDYRADDHEADPGYGPGQYRTGQHDDADFGATGYGHNRQGRDLRPQAWPDSEDRYQPDVTGQHSSADEDAGYGQQRFVPPYVRGQRDSSATGYSADSDYRLPADPGGGARHSPGRHSGGSEQ